MRASVLMDAGNSAITSQAITGGIDRDTGVTATGSGQSDAYAIRSCITEFTTVASSTGTRLPESVPGDTFMIVNKGANALAIYPPTGGVMNASSANAAINLGVGAVALIKALTNVNFMMASSDPVEIALLNGLTADAAELNTMDGILATTAELNAAADVSTRQVAAGGTLAMSQASHEGKTILLDTASGSVVTLPASTGGGAVYRFLVTVTATSNSHVIKVANASDEMRGYVIQDSDTATAPNTWWAADNDDTITLNRTTTGLAAQGEYFEIVDAVLNHFFVRGYSQASGTEATPFSATV